MRQKTVLFTLTIAAALAFIMSGCSLPTESVGAGDGSPDGGGTPAPVVNDYSTLFVSQGTILPGTDLAAIREDGSVSIGDVDGDGDQDVLLAGLTFWGSNRISEVYLNDGGALFTPAGAGLVGLDRAGSDFGDMDGDGDLDIALIGDDGSSGNGFTGKLYENTSTPSGVQFTEVTSTGIAAFEAGTVTFFDADGDDDQDLLVTGVDNSGTGNENYKVHLYRNAGPPNEGSYSLQVSDTNITNYVLYGSVSIADFDGMNGPDMFFTGSDFNGPGTALFMNNENDIFSASSNPPIAVGTRSSSSVADVNGDGFHDLLVTGPGDSGSRRADLYINNGSGGLTLKTGTPFIGVQESASAAGDVDLDGDLDFVIVGREEGSTTGYLRLYLNDGLGNFTEADTGSSLQAALSGTADFFDADGDTDLDLLITGDRGTTPSAILHINTLFD